MLYAYLSHKLFILKGIRTFIFCKLFERDIQKEKLEEIGVEGSDNMFMTNTILLMTILKKIEIRRHTCIRYFIVVVNPSSMFNQSFGVSGWLVSDLLSSFIRQLGSEPKILHLDCSQILLNFLVAAANFIHS